jgi:hypothetical protein
MAKIVRRKTESFPQADSLDRIVDLLVVCQQKKMDADLLAAEFGIVQRQAIYYYTAANYLDLAYLSGGWMRPTEDGRKILALPENDRVAAIGHIVLSQPVFSDVAQMYMEQGHMPEESEIASLIQSADSAVNQTTANRRAKTVKSWIEKIQEVAPEVLESIADQGNSPTTNKM